MEALSRKSKGQFKSIPYVNDGIQMIISKNKLYPHKFIPTISKTITATEKRINKYKRMNISDSLSNHKFLMHHISAPARE